MATTLPLNYTLTMYAGTTYTKTFRWKPDGVNPQDFTGWTAAMWMMSPGFAARQTFSNTDGSLTLTKGGQLTLNWSAAQTLTIRRGVYVYNVDLTSPTGVVTRFLTGRFQVVRDARSST